MSSRTRDGPVPTPALRIHSTCFSAFSTHSAKCASLVWEVPLRYSSTTWSTDVSSRSTSNVTRGSGSAM